jgi:hypothetical protein
MKRISIRRNSEATFIAFWLPEPITELMDQKIHRDDSDRSKFLRKCVKDQLIASGLLHPNSDL